MRGAQPAAYNRLVIKPGPRYANSSASFKTGSAFPQRQPAQFFLSWTCRPGQVKADVHLAPCPLFPQKRTCAVQLGMSALCQKRT